MVWNMQNNTATHIFIGIRVQPETGYICEEISSDS